VPPTPQRPPDSTSERTAARRSTERERTKHKRVIRQQRLLAFGLLALLVGAVALTVVLASTGPAHTHTSVTSSPAARRPRSVARPSSFAVGLRMLRLVDPSRTIQLPNGETEPRTLITYVRYPALGAAGLTDLPNAPAARSDGPFPLVVFGHGFALTPASYARILQSWARAGYVVAAPAFPLENAEAPGGPDESDLTNQPADMRFVISRMVAAGGAGSGPLAGLVDSTRIAVAGHSDGGDTALAVAYNRSFRDSRVGAVIVLSGAEMPGVGGFTFPRGSPPLLATQGTADTVNPPSATKAFFDVAQRPKYLLTLLGAEHLPPYSDEQPQLAIVERVTLAFLDGYLKHKPGAPRRLVSLGKVPGTATMIAEP
jgi:dienelactone hydrolase